MFNSRSNPTGYTFQGWINSQGQKRAWFANLGTNFYTNLTFDEIKTFLEENESGATLKLKHAQGVLISYQELQNAMDRQDQTAPPPDKMFSVPEDRGLFM